MNFYRFYKVHQRWCVHVSSKFGCIRCCWVITLFFKERALHTGLVTGLPLLPHLQELGNYLQENNIQMFHTLRQPCILFNAPCFLPLVGHLPSSLLLGSCAADRTTGPWWLTAGQTQCGLNGWTISSCLRAITLLMQILSTLHISGVKIEIWMPRGGATNTEN